MTAFIAATGQGDVPRRLDRVQDDLRGRPDAVRADARDEPGSRSGSCAGSARSTNECRGVAGVPRRTRGRRVSGRVPSVPLLLDRRSGSSRWGAAGRRRGRGLAPPRSRPAARPAVGRPADRGRAARDPRHPLPRHPADRLRRPDRRRTAIYLEEYADRDRWYNPLLEVNIQNLAAVPSIVYGILGPRVPRSRARPRPRAARGRADPDAARPADGDHRRARGDPGRARHRSARAPTRSARRSGRSSGARCFRRRSRESRPARSSRSRARSARRRRSLLVGALTYVAFNPTLLGTFTALPIQIFQWIGRPQEDFRRSRPRRSSSSC